MDKKPNDKTQAWTDDLPPKEPTAAEAASVKGGLRRRGNDEDDDLEDLEIQR